MRRACAELRSAGFQLQKRTQSATLFPSLNRLPPVNYGRSEFLPPTIDIRLQDLLMEIVEETRLLDETLVK